jgi:Holliday junction resolvase
MNGKAKGTRAEYRCMRLLESVGYICTRASASLGLFDVVAIGPRDVRCIQVKSGTRRLSALEREQLRAVRVPLNCTKEAWRFPDRCRDPLIEVL